MKQFNFFINSICFGQANMRKLNFNYKLRGRQYSIYRITLLTQFSLQHGGVYWTQMTMLITNSSVLKFS